MFGSAEELSKRLADTGYFIDPVMAQVVFLAAKLQKPLILEGPAGSGKTQLAVAVAIAAGTQLERLQCYRSITEEKAIGHFDDGLRRLYLEFSKGQHDGWESVRQNLRKREFILAGPLMRAIECDRPCVLLVDEIDKADEGFEAQAFKRAASCYGLGRYLYDLSETWVPLDERRQPLEYPGLPDWALPKTGAGGDRGTSGSKRGSIPHGPIDQKVTSRIEEVRSVVGDPIFGEILWRIARAWKANAIPNAQLQTNVVEAMERASRGVRKARSISQSISDTVVVSVLDRLGIASMDAIPSLAMLKELVRELERLAGSPAA
jgi:ATPase family associated with various cellular activities (AAA)